MANDMKNGAVGEQIAAWMAGEVEVIKASLGMAQEKNQLKSRVQTLEAEVKRLDFEQTVLEKDITMLGDAVQQLEQANIQLKKQMDEVRQERSQVPNGSRKRPRREADGEDEQEVKRSFWREEVNCLMEALRRLKSTVYRIGSCSMATVVEITAEPGASDQPRRQLLNFLELASTGKWYCFEEMCQQGGPSEYSKIKEGTETECHRHRNAYCVQVLKCGTGRFICRGKSYGKSA
ncbi:hypothetical protein GGS26DRAFT_598947 [Hypomontagnella submonticulosa]|nr:hypothetical protein GGS26DRAFT_598947 [Hypomontagnella submonticulosa]